MASPSFVFACDHASNALPAEAAGLGLPAAALTQHIALDLGAAELAMALGERFSAPVVLAPYSRLYIDCNRRLDDLTSIPETSDGTAIPGNQRLAPEARAARAGLGVKSKTVAITPAHAAGLATTLLALAATTTAHTTARRHLFIRGKKYT